MTGLRFLVLPLLALLTVPAEADIVMKPISCPLAPTGIGIVGAKGETDGVAAEYRWLRQNRPGWTRDSQRLIHRGDRDYDVLAISHGAEHEEICFDITEFFGKF
ncbi:MAG: hypothetical protein P4L82_22795 [Ancalomicrobiaceae bacterium]|nr:hypothetical protein [Ancalomicrobiaceae bacterium]